MHSEEILFPAFIKLSEFDDNIIMIVVPHEPTLVHLEKIENEFEGRVFSFYFRLFMVDY